MYENLDRRQFLTRAGLGTVALGIGAKTAQAKQENDKVAKRRARIRRARQAEASGDEQAEVSANDILSLGIIGTGGRGRNALMGALKKIPGVRIDAVCDVYEDFLNSAHASAGGRSRDVLKTQEYGDILERNDIDAVVIATPDHWHTPITIDACEAGKDVYCEKPITHKLEESKRLLEVRKRTGRVVQVGAQQRSMPHIRKLRNRIKNGNVNLGPVHRIHMQWNRNHTPFAKVPPKVSEGKVDWKRFLGNAPDQPFDAYRMRNWRWMWDFGNGPLGDLMVHWLDAANWVLDLPLPGRIVSIGGNYTTKGIWETPDTIHSIFSYPDRDLQIDFVATFSNDHEKGSMRIMGEEATIYVDRGRYEVTGQKKSGDKLIEQEISSKGPLGQGAYSDYNATALHLEDWLAAVRARRDPVDPVEANVLAADVCHYGNIAYREERSVDIPG